MQETQNEKAEKEGLEGKALKNWEKAYYWRRLINAEYYRDIKAIL